jgi:hypothetical protein
MFLYPDLDSHEGVLPRAVVVHGVEDARLALAPGLPVTLLSAPGAAIWAGVGWWRSLIMLAAQEHAADICDVLDCGDAPGRAMAALRAGQRRLVLDPACPAFARVASLGGLVLARRPPALDLGVRGEARRLKAWLRGEGCAAGADDDTGGGLR